MTRDDALYKVTDIRKFAPVRGMAGRVDAVRPLLAPGASVKWHERGDAERSTGFITLQRPDGASGHEGSENARGAISIVDPKQAWQRLCEAAVDAAWLRDVSTRLVESASTQGAPTVWRPLEYPQTLEAVLALAEGGKDARAAEEQVRELFRRLEPFGGGACPPIRWRTMTRPERTFAVTDRSALQPLASALFRTLDRDVYRQMERDTQRECSFGQYSELTDIYRWVATDLARLRIFDLARSQGVTLREDPVFNPPLPSSVVGVSLAGKDSPWESLLRIGVLGFQVQVLSSELVVMVAFW